MEAMYPGRVVGRGYETGRLGLDHNCHAKEFGFHPVYHEEAVQRLLVGAWHF